MSANTEPDVDDLIDAAAASATAEPNVAAGEAAPSASVARPHACDVLIADDTGASRELLSAILRNFAGGLRLREARNGIDALEMWTRLNPRITMLDIDMPGMDGLEALQKIRAARGDAFVAMVSAGSALENVRKALSLGASGYIIKPYKPQRILDLLAKYRQVTGYDPLTGKSQPPLG